VKIDEEIEVVVLNIDHDKEKIALGLKQKSASPWEEVEKKYPVGTRVKGTVVNIMSYGAFVKLEEGLEGLVHISEMSWTRRVSHPSEMVSVGSEVEVIVLEIDKDKQEISLGMKQAEMNPWTVVKEKYPPGTVITGTVRNMTNFGAFVEIEEGIDGLLHVSDLSWTRKIGHPSEVLKKSQELQCVVLAVDEEKMRVALGLKQLTEDPWLRMIPEHYVPGQIVKGKATKITNFGVFVELEDELEGLLHVSELADHKVENPRDVVKVGDEIEVKILRVDTEDRKIGLSLKRAQWAAEEGGEGAGGEVTPRRGGLEGQSGPLIGTDIIDTVRREDQ
jgi:small subunit ribosomal protein S1